MPSAQPSASLFVTCPGRARVLQGAISVVDGEDRGPRRRLFFPSHTQAPAGDDFPILSVLEFLINGITQCAALEAIMVESVVLSGVGTW